MTSGKQMESGFITSIDDRYLEDYLPGAVHKFGPLKVSEAEIIAFGRKFDPQEFHTDPEAAKDSAYGGLIASGWHTSALFMRLFVDHYLTHNASLGSPGVDELRWLAPVRPGDELMLRITVHQTRRSQSKPDRGILHSFVEVVNQENIVVSTMMAINLVLCREPG